MNRAHLSAALLMMLALLVSGCSPAANTSAPVASPTQSVDCDDPDITVKQWDDNCAGADEGTEPTGGEESPGEEPVTPFGQAIEYTKTYSDDTPGGTFEVKLSKVECGLNSLPKAESNPDWDGGDEKPRHIDATAPKGSDFCVLYWDWENVGKVPDSTTQSGDLMFGDEQWARTGDDESRSWTFMETKLDVDYSVSVNPRKRTKSADIYTVDEGRVPTAVRFPMDTMMDGQQFLMATK